MLHDKRFESRDFDDKSLQKLTGNDQKPEIFYFFQFFDLPKEKFSNLYFLSCSKFLLRVLYRLDFKNQFSGLEDTENDQKSTLPC